MWTQVCSGSTLFASIINSSVMLGNYLQQTTSADNIFKCIFFLGPLRVKPVLFQRSRWDQNGTSTSYGVYISQLIRFARASSYVADFNTRNKLLTQKLLKQGYRYHKLRKTFSKFYRRYYDLISKFQVGLKSLLRQGLSEPDFYGDLVYKLKKIVGSNNFSAQFIKIISHYKKIGYNINVLQQTACLVVNPITVGNFAFLFNCMPVGRTSDSMMVPT